MRLQNLTTTGATLALALIAGCAGSRQAAQKPSGEPAAATPGLPTSVRVTPAFEEIVRLAIAQAQRPIDGTRTYSPPPGLPEELTKVVSQDGEEGANARTPLADVIRLLLEPPTEYAAETVTEADKDAALRRYIAGREKLLEGHPQEALEDLRASTALDPRAGEPWRELGEAQLIAGLQTDAVQSFQNAHDRGIREARVLELLGRAALDQGDTKAAARQLAAAYEASPERIDPLLPAIIDVQLAKALAQEGYLRAALEAIDRAFATRQQLTSSTRYGAEFGTIYRRQGEIWREAGDMRLRLGDYSEALEAYARTAALPVMDGISITPRLAFAAVRSGRPAAAAVFLLEGLASREGRTRAEDATMLAYVAQAPSMARPLAAAIANYRMDLAAREGGVAPTVHRSLTQLEAAVAPVEQRRELLRAHLKGDPTDIRAAVALLNECRDIAAAATEATRIVANEPSSAPFVAEAIFRSRHRVTPDAVAAAKTWPAQILAAYIATGHGNARQGLEFLPPATGSSQDANLELARTQLAVSAGQPDRAAEPMRRMAAIDTPAGHRSRARALLLFQKPSAARVEMQRVLEAKDGPAPQRITDLLLAAEIATQLLAFDEAELHLLEARRLDPQDERPLTQLLELYSGPLQDQARFNQLVRDLRQGHDDGRAIRTLRVRELLRRSMLAPAEREILALVEEEPGDLTTLRLLVGIWEEVFKSEPAQAERARTWIDEKLARRGDAPAYMMAMTAVEIAAGASQLAEPRLRDALERTQSPDISRLLEKLLRDHLHRGAEADDLALRRLEGRDRTPAESMELAQIYAGKDRPLDCVGALRTALETADTLTTEQTTFVLEMASSLGRRAVDQKQVEAQEVASWLFQRLVDRGATLRPDDHEVRLVLLARRGSIPELLAAAKLTVAQHAALGQGAYIRAIRALLVAERFDDAVRFAKQSAEAVGSPTPEFIFDYFRVLTLAGTASDIRDFIAISEPAGQLKTLIERITGSPVTGDVRAEAAYMLGNFLSSNNKPQKADAAYELAIEYDPNHAWACNNLGYSLADRNENMDRASDLLERAHAALPNEPSITDSLGWLRYKQGILEDQTRADGTTLKGALSLLKEAVETAHGAQDPTILDHYGDALWLVGHAAEAANYWQLASNYSSRKLRPTRPPGATQEEIPSDAAAVEYREIIARTTQKRDLMGTGQWVPVAPQANNPRPTPPPTAAPATGEPSTAPGVGSSSTKSPANAG